MRTIPGQRVASTHADLSGERLSREFLDRYASAMAGKRHPLNNQHDLSRRTIGYVDNYRLEPDSANPGEWFLLADVYLDDDASLEGFGGFSISGSEMIFEPPQADAKMLLSYPHYNDESLLRSLADDERLAVGRWIKKAAGDVEWGVLLGSMLVFLLAPAWDDIYKRKIAPRVGELVETYLQKIKPKGLGAELLQVVQFSGRDVQVRFIPTRSKEEVCLRSDSVLAGLRVVAAFLQNDAKSSTVGVRSIVLFYDEGKSAYALHRIEYEDGSVEHSA